MNPRTVLLGSGALVTLVLASWALVALGTAPAAAAGEPTDEPVPRPLLEREIELEPNLETLAGILIHDDARTAFTLGRVPDDLAELLPVPDGTSVVGSTRSHESAIVVLASENRVVPMEPGQRVDLDLVHEYEALLLERGWTAHASPDTLPTIVSARDEARRPAYAFCHDAGFFLHILRGGYPNFPTLRLHIHPRESCDSPVAPHHPIPRVVLPEDVDFLGMSGRGGMGDAFEASAGIRTDRAPASLAQALADQLEDAGWTPEGSTDLGAHHLRTFTTESFGRDWTALLLVEGDAGSGSTSVLLRASSPATGTVFAPSGEPISIQYETEAVVLQSGNAVAVVAFEPAADADGATYRYRLLNRSTGEETTGEGAVFENSTHTRTADGDYVAVDDGGILHVHAGPLRVDWAFGRYDLGWIYPALGREPVTVQVVEREQFETLDLAAH